MYPELDSITPSETDTGRPGRLLVVLSRASDARDLAAALMDTLEMDLTVVRDARAAERLLVAAGPGRYSAVLCESEVRGHSGLELLSQAKNIDYSIVTMLVTRLPPSILEQDAMFFVDHHVPARLEPLEMAVAVRQAMGVEAPESTDPARTVHFEVTRVLPMAPSPAPLPFGSAREHTIAQTPMPSPMGPVTWGNELGNGLQTGLGRIRRFG